LLKEHERRDVAKGTSGLVKDTGGRVAGYDAKSSRCGGPPRPTRHASNELIEAIDKVIEAKEEKNGRLKEVNELVQNTPEAPVEEKREEACQQAGKADFKEKDAEAKQEDDDAENQETIVASEDKKQKNETEQNAEDNLHHDDVPSDDEHVGDALVQKVGDASVQKVEDAEQLSDDADPREEAIQLDEDDEVLGDAGQPADADTHADDSHIADDSNQLAKNSNHEAAATAPPFTFSDFIQPTPREGADSPNLSIASEESEALVVATDRAEDSLRPEADREADEDGQEAERRNTLAPRAEIRSEKKEKEKREEEEEAKEKLQVRPQKKGMVGGRERGSGF